MAVEHRGLPVSRRRFVQGAGAAGLGLLAGCRQSPESTKPLSPVTLGFVASGALASTYEPFREALAEHGYIVGQDIVVEARAADGYDERLPELVTELVGWPVALLVAVGPPAARAALQATRTIPVVMVNISDPVEQGWIASLGRPGGNATGVANISQRLVGKRLEILKDVVPRISRVAVLRVPANTTSGLNFVELDKAAAQLGLGLLYQDVESFTDVEAALDSLLDRGADGFVQLPYSFLLVNARRLVDLLQAREVPAIFDRRGFVAGGGLLAYAPDADQISKRAAYFVDRILRGSPPGGLPVEQPSRFELIINLRTAQALGLTIPPHVLLQATEVIQ